MTHGRHCVALRLRLLTVIHELICNGAHMLFVSFDSAGHGYCTALCKQEGAPRLENDCRLCVLPLKALNLFLFSTRLHAGL